MRNLNKLRQTGCPVAFGLDTFGDRWSFLVLRDMMLNGKKTYGDFLEMDEAIATNILADRLKHLQAEGILNKSRDPENLRRNIYTLTEKGLELAPVILEIIRWSGAHMSLDTARKRLWQRIQKDRDGLLAEITSRVKAG